MTSHDFKVPNSPPDSRQFIDVTRLGEYCQTSEASPKRPAIRVSFSTELRVYTKSSELADYLCHGLWPDSHDERARRYPVIRHLLQCVCSQSENNILVAACSHKTTILSSLRQSGANHHVERYDVQFRSPSVKEFDFGPGFGRVPFGELLPLAYHSDWKAKDVPIAIVRVNNRLSMPGGMTGLVNGFVACRAIPDDDGPMLAAARTVPAMRQWHTDGVSYCPNLNICKLGCSRSHRGYLHPCNTCIVSVMGFDFQPDLSLPVRVTHTLTTLPLWLYSHTEVWRLLRTEKVIIES